MGRYKGALLGLLCFLTGAILVETLHHAREWRDASMCGQWVSSKGFVLSLAPSGDGYFSAAPLRWSAHDGKLWIQRLSIDAGWSEPTEHRYEFDHDTLRIAPPFKGQSEFFSAHDLPFKMPKAP